MSRGSIKGMIAAAALVAAFAALSIAAGPAVAQAPDAQATNAANRALDLARAADKRAGKGVKKARQALQKARQALNKGRQAFQAAAAAQAAADDATALAQRASEAAAGAADLATKALADAKAALAAAGAANARLDAAEPVSASENDAVTTASETDYVQLGGPELTATVPASGRLEVWASVRFDDPADGAVALFEDGQQVIIPGQDGLCGTPDLPDALLSAQLGSGLGITLSTPPALVAYGGCGSIGGAPGPIMLKRAPGTHTYELRYADCGCDPGDAIFSNRSLMVAGRP